MIKESNNQMPLVIIMITVFILQLGVGLVIPILPKFIQAFGVNGATLGYLVSAMGLTQFIFSPMAGEWSDQHGRRKIILLGIGMFSISQWMFGLGQDLWMLYVSRLLGGIGIAFTTPAIMAYTADITTEENRGKSLGWMGAAMSLGIVIGPGIGGFLAEYGLRIPFYMAAAASALAMLAAFIMLPETLSREEIKKARSVSTQKESMISQIALSFTAPYFFWLLLIFVLTFALMSVEVVFGLYVDVKYGFTPQDIALLFTAGALMGTFIQAVAIDKLLQRFGEKRLIKISILSAAASLFFMLLAASFWYIVIATTLFISFASILRPALNTLLSKMAGQEQGFVAGLNNSYTSLGIIIGPAIGGIFFDIHIDLPYLFGILLILSSLAIQRLGVKRMKGVNCL